jgi:hypothetical protein
MRYTPVRCTPVRYPLICEVHACICKMHVYEVYAAVDVLHVWEMYVGFSILALSDTVLICGHNICQDLLAE